MIEDQIYNLIKKIFNYPRSITGHGTLKTLKVFKTIVPELKIIKVKSRKKINGWIVPDEWNFNRAYIKDSKGNFILDTKKSNLHVVNFSQPIKKKINLNNLKKNIFSIRKIPDAIPYVTSYYEKSWGFCMEHSKKIRLKKDIYEINIDTKIKKGHLNYGEIYIKGKSRKEVLISTYICHPSMANNELSGPCLSLYLAKYIKNSSNFYSYRFIFIPEIIGSIIFIEKNKKILKNVKYAFNINCVGDNKSISFLPSRTSSTISDKLAIYVLNELKLKYKKYNFIDDRGSDERNFCSPNVNVPMVSIMRSKHGTYKEYHTSKDDLNFISKSGLKLSFNIYINCFLAIEKNFIYKSKLLGEPFLTSLGYGYKLIAGKNNIKSINSKLILDVLSCLDSKSDLIDVSSQLNISINKIHEVIILLEKNKLVQKITV
mgnify:CR=1 FL=1|tara:strand:+ start:5468 stop:6754 length:1287 start_codon:yes stop_codon:yes gene_type:complete